jgi:hypothetical protein
MALRSNLHTLTGVYALDALETGAELARFERHLTKCQSCATEVRGFRETAAGLGIAAMLPPPPAMRGTVMAAVGRTRQLPAADEHARHARPAPRQGLLPRLATAGAALSLAAAITLGVVLVNTQHELNRTRQQLSQAQVQLAAITAVRTAADAQTVSKVTKVGGRVTVVSSASRHQIVVTTSGLPPLRAGKVYQLWLIGHPPNKIRSEGMLVMHNGRSGPTLISGVLAGDTFGLTIEPAGGSIQPTLKTLSVTIPAS